MNPFDILPKEDDLLNLIMLTSNTVWNEDGISEKDIELWLGNFTGKIFDTRIERNLALYLLCNFTYYNRKEVEQLCCAAYSDFLHHILINNCIRELAFDEIIKKFFQKSNIISSEETSGSGGYIAYLFRQQNSLPIKNLFNFSLDNLHDDIENIIVIDDVTLSSGSKSQMYKFWKKVRVQYPNKNYYLITLIATVESIRYHKDILSVNTICPIKLDDRDKCFHNDSNIFISIPSIIEKAKMIAEHYGKIIYPEHPLGYNDGQFLFGFYYNTPNNTLPIFWSQKKGWKPILTRYQKKYNSQRYINNEKYL